MARRRLIVLVLLSLASTLLLLAAKRRNVLTPNNQIPQLHLDRSFAISDEDVLAGFPFERVLNALIETSGVPDMTAETLFRQWMDTQNAKPGLSSTMPHCDDELTDGNPSLNGFPIQCPTSEGLYAIVPFEPETFIPILIMNRFGKAILTARTAVNIESFTRTARSLSGKSFTSSLKARSRIRIRRQGWPDAVRSHSSGPIFL